MPLTGIRAADAVLDIGCGTGLTTREAGRAAAPGRAVGIDLSERALERAVQITAAQRLGNVSYQLGDAQTHPFAPGAFDVAISRFATMSFADPAEAFANIAAALRPGARLVQLVWQRSEDNDWAKAIAGAFGAAAQPPAPGADPFLLGDADSTAHLLEQAGFDRVRFEDVREPVFYGRDIHDGLETVRGFQGVSAALAGLDDDETNGVVDRLRQALAAHDRDGPGVVFDSRSWLITARRHGRR